MDELFTHTLPNGLRLVHVARQSEVGWCGLAAGAGSRDEEKGKYGLAHFVEHTLFKGTTHRNSARISSRMESVGGELNAFTSKEDTFIYSLFPKQHLARAVQLIADIVSCSTFPPHQLERELGVVLEEAASCRDNPADAAYDDVEDILFAGSQLGHNILGNETDLRSIASSDCLSFLKSCYVPGNMVFFTAGAFSPDVAFRLAEHYMGGLDHELRRQPRVAPTPFAASAQAPAATAAGTMQQAHYIMAHRAPSMHDERRYATLLLNNMLAGPGMNSILNNAMREKRGLVYTVESSYNAFTDCGLLEIYFECEHNNVRRALRIIKNAIDRIASGSVTSSRLNAFKRQFCGQLLVASDGTEYQAINAGKSMLYYGHVYTLAQIVERYRSVTPQQVQQAAIELASGNWAHVAVG